MECMFYRYGFFLRGQVKELLPFLEELAAEKNTVREFISRHLS